MLDLDLMPVSRLGKSAPTSICCGIRSLSPAAIGRCSVCARLTVLPFHPPGRNADPDGQAASDKVDTDEADEVIDSIAKTVAELTSQQDGVIRQQVIEQLMQEIMKYDAEFRREEATSPVRSHAKHDGASDRVEHAPRPHPTLDWAGAVPYRERVPSKIPIRSIWGINLLNGLTVNRSPHHSWASALRNAANHPKDGSERPPDGRLLFALVCLVADYQASRVIELP